jgi:hypothetical protein
VTKHPDTILLNALQRKIKLAPLLLWDGHGEFPGGRGSRALSLLRGGKTLREAIKVLMTSKEIVELKLSRKR